MSGGPAITSGKPVCIIGAGVAGLYTAMILKSLNIPYEILELSGDVGGRLYTYDFPNNGDGYQYYDVGAMRFPKTPFMKRTFDLVDRINEASPDRLKWIKYIFKADNTFSYFNGVRLVPSSNDWVANPDPYRINDYTPHYIPNQYASLLRPMELQQALNGIMQRLKADFVTMDIDTAMRKLIQNYDQYSMRSYLSLGPDRYPSEVIDLFEAFDKSTGWYDRALVETVCESLAFSWTDTTTLPDYYCLDKGSSQLPHAMKEQIDVKRIQFNTRVTSVSYINPDDPASGLHVESSQGTWTAQQDFGAVICTTPVSTLNLIDLTGCGINENYAQYSAIRELQYGPAIKVGIQFSKNWWEPLGIVGGQSYTDLPVRTVVYPSYPESGTKSATLIASYCWTQDAERLGALIENGKMSPLLRSLVLKDLATIHGIDVKELEGLVVDSYAFNWLHNPATQGGFAFFGPQQFSNKTYTELTQPAAQGQLYFAGEATSACHAWVAGALDSAWNSIEQFLITYNYPQSIRDSFHEQWGSSEYWDEQKTKNQIKLGLARSGVRA
ncbi:amine oxidase [Punctularia strigosozonata HHB-11173 SS5]|uniref:amine oxidase n=1 Tax=Punctularia strigosozonata (strain HHB-11173) TaxID=741275 RepID=UPI0004417DED|nr:amine oxidase [Punctularia strigosozonata HHB-11173 SS5]EIN12605.1 amine oxidase [Punctularia strigosozonata HHB-11173 SS5]